MEVMKRTEEILKSPDSSDWVEVNSNYLVRQRNKVRVLFHRKK